MLEFRRWQAMQRIEPFGDDWLQAASIVAKVHNVNCKEKIKPTDAIPKYEVQKAATHEQSQALFKTFGSAVNAAGKKKTKPK